MDLTKGKGILELAVNDKDWIYSDDTVMHIATALALVTLKKTSPTDDIAQKIAIEYVKCWDNMDGRAPGNGTRNSVMRL